MKVSSIVYKPIEGGALGGHFALHVTLGGGNSASVFSPSDLATKIHDCFDSLGVKTKIKAVLIDFRVAVETADDMMSLLGVLKDWGLNIVLWVGQTTRYPWFEYAFYITVFVTQKHWPNFRVNEIRYVITSEDPDVWMEPEVYEVNANSTCYIAIEDRGLACPRGAITAFSASCLRPWGVIRTVGGVNFKLE